VRRRPLATLVATVALVFSGSTSTAYALWTAHASTTFTVSLSSTEESRPPAPTDLSCARSPQPREAAFELSWQGQNHAGYTVYRTDVSSLVATSNNTRTRLTMADLGSPEPSDGSYTVAVRSVVGGVESADSAAVSLDYSAETCAVQP
jgi:hypothetical protein